MKKIGLYCGLLFSFLYATATFAQTNDDNQSQFVQRVVMEEYTGTWCGNCPRGSVGMKRLAEDFGERVICIAVHSGSGEPMQISAYPDLQPGSGIPACELNRTGKLDPYSGSGSRGYRHYGIDADAEQLLAQPAKAGIKLKAEWADTYQWDVSFNVETTFAESENNSHYSLALILMEDGLEGGGRAWEQVNYYSAEYENSLSKDYTDDDMKEWVDAPARVSNVVYNHVPVNTYGIKDGIPNSIASPIVAGEKQQYKNIVTTLSQKVIQDKQQLYAVVLLLDTDTKQIVNADRAEIAPYGTSTGITTLQTAKHNCNNYIYNLNGQKLSNTPTRGLYIKNGKKYIF